jgi:hypothetical protein
MVQITTLADGLEMPLRDPSDLSESHMPEQPIMKGYLRP